MAESGAERTEHATPKRLEEARKKGQVPRSIELSMAAVCLAAAAAIYTLGRGAAAQFADLNGGMVDEDEADHRLLFFLNEADAGDLDVFLPWAGLCAGFGGWTLNGGGGRRRLSAHRSNQPVNSRTQTEKRQHEDDGQEPGRQATPDGRWRRGISRRRTIQWPEKGRGSRYATRSRGSLGYRRLGCGRDGRRWWGRVGAHRLRRRRGWGDIGDGRYGNRLSLRRLFRSCLRMAVWTIVIGRGDFAPALRADPREHVRLNSYCTASCLTQGAAKSVRKGFGEERFLDDVGAHSGPRPETTDLIRGRTVAFVFTPSAWVLVHYFNYPQSKEK